MIEVVIDLHEMQKVKGGQKAMERWICEKLKLAGIPMKHPFEMNGASHGTLTILPVQFDANKMTIQWMEETQST